LNKNKHIDEINVGEGEVLLLEVRTMGGQENQRSHKSPFALIEARSNQVKSKVQKNSLFQ
jgi:hypothetical protein